MGRRGDPKVVEMKIVYCNANAYTISTDEGHGPKRMEEIKE